MKLPPSKNYMPISRLNAKGARHVAVCINFVLLTLLVYWLCSILPGEETSWGPSSFGLRFTDHPTASVGLLQKLREAVRRGGGVPGRHITGKDRARWEAAHPCRSRREFLTLLNTRKRANLAPRRNRKWEEILREYENLHRTCTRRAGFNFAKEFHLRGTPNASSSACDFLTVEFVDDSAQIGDKALWLVSNFLYAILTQRVLLVDTRSTVHLLFCEPFPGSSWAAPRHFPFAEAAGGGGGGEWLAVEPFLAAWDYYLAAFSAADQTAALTLLRESSTSAAAVQNFVRGPTTTRTVLTDAAKPPPPSFQAVNLMVKSGLAMARFLCNTEQMLLKRVQWVTLGGGHSYFLPSLFAISDFQGALEELFPDRTPLTTLLRYLAMPRDEVWKPARNIYDNHFGDGDWVVGVQLRFMGGSKVFKQIHKVVDEKARRCAIENHLLPRAHVGVDDKKATRFSNSTSTKISPTNKKKVVVFITSPHRTFRNHLEKYYSTQNKSRRTKTAAKSRSKFGNTVAPNSVQIVQLLVGADQVYNGYTRDRQDLAEILALSLSDALIVTRRSTFGGLAQGYGGLNTWLLNYGIELDTTLPTTPACVQNQAVDACFQAAPQEYVCPFETALNGKRVTEVVPFLEVCQDDPTGLQIVDLNTIAYTMGQNDS